MAESANVSSLDAIQGVREAVIRFSEDAKHCAGRRRV